MAWHPAVAAQQSRQGRRDLLTTEQVAHRLHKTPQRITQLCREGRLEGIKVGERKWLISVAAIQKYLEYLKEKLA